MATELSSDYLRAYESAEVRLLLATAKPFLDKNQLEEIGALVREVKDWDFVAETAIRKFSAPYLRRAVSLIGSDVIPQRTVKRLKQFSERTNFKALKTAAAQLAFHKTCILPINARHAYLKGAALCIQFNGVFADRLSRDIDVLVEKQHFERVIHEAVRNGYRAVLTTNPLGYVKTSNDLKFVMQFSSDVGLVSPDGVLIEVHRRLDKKNFIFDAEQALNSTKAIELSGVKMQTLEPNFHFIYVCYHHSRHLWSHLHWMADLDLMLRSEELNHKKLQETAQDIGLHPTVNAAIKMHEILSNEASWHRASPNGGLEYDFLRACLLNLKGDLDLEYKLREKSFGHDLMSRSQVSPEKLSQTRSTVWRNKFHPTLSQYLKRPLPSSFFWLYRVQRALIEGRQLLFSKDAVSLSQSDSIGEAEKRSLHEQREDDSTN